MECGNLFKGTTGNIFVLVWNNKVGKKYGI